MHITSSSPLLLSQPVFIYYNTVLQFFAEACQGTIEMSIRVIHLRQECDSLLWIYSLLPNLCIAALLN